MSLNVGRGAAVGVDHGDACKDELRGGLHANDS